MLVPDDFYRGLQNKNTAHFYLNEKKRIFPALFEAINFLSIKYSIRNFISKFSDNNKEKNKYDLIKESVQIFNIEMKRLHLLNKKFFIFYTPSKNNSALNNLILNKVIEEIDFEIIDLSKDITDEMLKDSVHYNGLGHNLVSDRISKKILEYLK